MDNNNIAKPPENTKEMSSNHEEAAIVQDKEIEVESTKWTIVKLANKYKGKVLRFEGKQIL